LNYSNEETHGRVSAPVGDIVFEAGINCLAAANKVVRRLDIRHTTRGDFQWDRFSSWDDLDLTQLHSLAFEPNVLADTEGPGREQEIELAASRVLSATLDKCRTSLERLKFRAETSGWGIVWPSVHDRVVSLPSLWLFMVDSEAISPDKFAAWFAGMPDLKTLKLSTSHLIRGSHYADWRILYDAIRRHPRGIRIILEQICANDAAEISLNYDTVLDLQGALDEEVYDDPWDDIRRSLSLYLSGRIEWNASLQMWHE
jgi:hypothetical protein